MVQSCLNEEPGLACENSMANCGNTIRTVTLYTQDFLENRPIIAVTDPTNWFKLCVNVGFKGSIMHDHLFLFRSKIGNNC